VAKEIIISERENIAATFENGKIVEFFMNEGEQLVGDIILGKVESVVQSIDAAFISIGKNRNGFIHVTDLSLKVRRKVGIKNVLRPKQSLLVQIAKEATGSKGPRLTGMLTIPGKYMVLTPYERKVGISKKISDTQERDRLVYIAKNICQSGYGIIVRTEAIGQSEEALKEDLDFLLKRWHEILTMSEKVQAPAVLYRDQDLLYRVLRDSVTSDVEKITVDTHDTKTRAIELLQSWSNNAFRHVSLNRNPAPLAIQYNLFGELEKALQPRAPLPSGGYLIIEQTEALTVIDVNSGSTRGTSSLNETILQTNKEAAVEIARQLRLRDIGGVIVVDFIDMVEQREQQIVWQILANAVKPDKSQPQIGYFSEFSLLEMTRHRQKKSLTELLTSKCPYCVGIGRIRNHVYRADILDIESIKKRVPTPESIDKSSSESGPSNNKMEELMTDTDYVENKMGHVPAEVAKYRQSNETTQISYPKFDRNNKSFDDKADLEVDYETIDDNQEKTVDFDIEEADGKTSDFVSEDIQEKPVSFGPEVAEKGSDFFEEEVQGETITFSEEERQYIESIEPYNNNRGRDRDRNRGRDRDRDRGGKKDFKNNKRDFTPNPNAPGTTGKKPIFEQRHNHPPRRQEVEAYKEPVASFNEANQEAVVAERQHHISVPEAAPEIQQTTLPDVSENYALDIIEEIADTQEKMELEISEAMTEVPIELPEQKKPLKKKPVSRGRKPAAKKESAEEAAAPALEVPQAALPVVEPVSEGNNGKKEKALIATVDTDSASDSTEKAKPAKLRRIRSFSPKKRK
jgi:Rne/Rng family ribonuclease